MLWLIRHAGKNTGDYNTVRPTQILRFTVHTQNKRQVNLASFSLCVFYAWWLMFQWFLTVLMTVMMLNGESRQKKLHFRSKRNSNKTWHWSQTHHFLEIRNSTTNNKMCPKMQLINGCYFYLCIYVCDNVQIQKYGKHGSVPRPMISICFNLIPYTRWNVNLYA